MEYRTLDYSSLDKRFSHGYPNRLCVLVHPGWDHRVGIAILPLWKEYLVQVAQDQNQSLLVISGYGPETVGDHESDSAYREFAQKQKLYNEDVREWVVELAEHFQGRFAEWKHGLLPNDEKHRSWVKDALGNPPDILHYELTKDGIKETMVGLRKIRLGAYDFFTISFSGMYYDTCVDWQRESFPCSALWPKGYWNCRR